MKLSQYKNSQKGNISVLSALIIVPILICIGVAIDYARLVNIRGNLQASADSASLAGAVAYARTGKDTMVSEGKAAFNYNKDRRFTYDVNSLNVELTDNETILVTSHAQTKPIFMSMFGFDTMDINVSSTAVLSGRVGAELSIAIDATNSMAFGSSWNDTIGTIENILKDLQNLSGEDNFYVTLVPFQDRVNIGNSIQPSWIKKNGHYNASNSTDCVEPREQKVGSFNWMLTDDKPNSQKFTPMAKDAEFSDGRDVKCPSIPITGPTSDVGVISQKIKQLTTAGTGRYDVGLAWAWRSLSPDWQGQWGVKDYPFDPKKNQGINGETEARKKYLIYMTDGRSNAYKMEAMEEESWGWNNGSQQAFEHIAELCSDIKAQDIEIYMLHIPGNPNSTPYFKGCASSPDHYIVVDKAKDVALAFSNIQEDLLSELRIVR